MDIREAGQLTAHQEYEHWWIQTRFRYLERALALPFASPTLRVLEVGCGTGQNLQFLRQESELSERIVQLVGVEPAWPLQQSMPVGLRPTDQIVPSLASMSPSDPFDLLLAMDVLEHIDDDRGALKDWVAYLKPGARVFITVPAFQALWSRHDELLHHWRRYTVAHVAALAKSVALQPITICYAFSYLFVPAYVLRVLLPRRARAQHSDASLRDTTDLALAPPLLNSFLRTVGWLESKAGGSSWCGTSVIGYFEKPAVETAGA